MSYVDLERKHKDERFLIESHTNNPHSGLLRHLIKRMPADILDDLVEIQTDCKIHGSGKYFVSQAQVEAGNTGCQRCRWDREARQKQWAADRDKLMNTVSLPIEHRAVFFDKWGLGGTDQLKQRQKHILERLKQYASAYRPGAKNILLTGPTGTGKTKLACLLANEIIRASYHPGMTVVFKRSGQIQSEIKAMWKDKQCTDTQAAYIDRLSRANVLIIDEVGEGDTSIGYEAAEADRERLSAILDLRYQRQLPTIITTNLNDRDFYNHIGDRAADRIAQRVIQIPCTWPSFRKVTQQAEIL